MRVLGSFLIGSAGFVGVAVAVAWVSNASLPTPADAARVDPAFQMEPAPFRASVPFNAAGPVVDAPAAPPVRTVTDVRNFYASGELPQPSDWLFNPEVMPIRPAVVAAVPAGVPAAEAVVETVSAVPLPVANPLAAGRVMAGNEPEDALTLAPLPPRKPKIDPQTAAQIAALPPPMEEDVAPEEPSPPAAAEAPKDELRYPKPGDRFAIYDIKAKMLYLPNGKKLESHSGYGEKMDDIRYAHVRMEGVTPPNRYKLRMREALFQGTEAVRMTPVDNSKMFGRNGFLLHPYLMGPRGDSNGCVSVRDYDTFLASFKRGEIDEVIVVASMPGSAKPLNPLLSWLTGRRD